jgi:PAS domain S-box-containing protein
MVCRFRPDGSIVFANGAYARSCGRTPEEVQEQNFWNLIPAADRDEVRAMLEALTPDSPVVRIENRFITTEGERWTLWTNRALRFDADGRLIEAQSTGIDITDRKRAEQALAHEQEKMRLLADTIPQLAWMARPDGYIFWYNKRWYEYTGATPAAMEGWGWQSVHDPSVLPEVLARWTRSIASGEAFEMVFPLRGADGLFRSFLTRVNPLRDAQGRVLYWFGTNTDVSEIKRMEEQLRESDRRKDEFLAVLSHELRNPLAPIKNIVALLRTPGADTSMVRQALPVLERQVGHLIRLVDDLLDVARINRGDIVLQKRATNLAEIVSAAVETSRPLIDARGHHLEVELANGTDVVFGDPVRLAQVVANVLNNAATYTAPGGNLEISTRSAENCVELRVRDNGPGIPPETLKSMFDLFKRGDNAREHPAGFGIGLALARRLVEMHGGSIDAHSDGPNLGSEFVIRLPIERVEPKLVDSAVGHDKAATGKRILVVDDNIDAARSLAMLLETIGADVGIAGDGPSALEAFATEQPSVVILDIGMPGMSGHDVAREIRTRYPNNPAVLVAHTGWGQEDDRRSAAEAGFEFHLVKPAELSALQEILAKVPAGR